MARLIRIFYQPHNDHPDQANVKWVASRHSKVQERLPQIVWDDGSPFRPANVWATVRLSSGSSIKTVDAELSKLLSYANFLEARQLDWFHFPKVKSERCLLLYRGFLIEKRDSGELSASGATQRMNVAINFYRFLLRENLIDPNLNLWKERRFSFSIFDPHGFERTVRVRTTDLSIPNRSRQRLAVEDGLMPLSKAAVDQLIQLTKSSPTELRLMLAIGFQTGMRIGTIADLKVATLRNAVPDPSAPGSMRISIGPAASPAVSTKNGVTGQISIPEPLFRHLLHYAHSVRRLKRQAKATGKNSELVFITAHGNPYSSNGSDSSQAIRTFTYELRQAAKVTGSRELAKFHFHQTRATFGTNLTSHLLKQFKPNQVLAFVKSAMLHAREATTMIYIRFIEETPMRDAAADAFTNEFMGLLNEAD